MSNDNEQRTCTCTTPEYTIKLNKQGPPGLGGTQGEPGFSPEIVEYQNDADAYRLQITTAEDSFITPNLRVNNLPTGGVFGQYLMKTSSNSFECSWNSLNVANEDIQGIIRTATTTSIWENTEEDYTAVTPFTLKATAILSGDVRLAIKTTQASYDATNPKDANTLYLIVEENE